MKIQKNGLLFIVIVYCLIFLSLIFTSAISFSEEDAERELLLKFHTEHAFHVRKLGMALVKLSDQFGEVDPEVLNRFLYLHQISKRNFLSGDQSGITIKKDHPFYNSYSIFKTDVTTLSKAEYDVAINFLNFFEESDRDVATEFFREEGILGPNEVLENNPLVQKYLRIERIANTVERGRSRLTVIEFGRSVMPGHSYFDQVKKDRDSAKLALRLQYEYYTTDADQSEAPRFVRSYDEYRLYNFTHILRVTRLGMSLWEGEKNDSFADIDPKILEEFLLLHDQSKINYSHEFSTRHNIFKSETVSSRLYQNYGIDFTAIPDDWKKETSELVDHLNAIDQQVAIDFFRKKGLLGASESIENNALVQKYLHIEKIADLVDRGSSPVTKEEFGRAMIPAHTFFIKALKDFESATYAAVLEYNYKKIVSGDEYLDNVPLMRLALKRHKWDSAGKRFERHVGECMQIMTEHFLSNYFPSFSIRGTSL
ncbi:MAG: hypothetical protein ISR65_09355 [Bacteriovoracaceae bacterium]|nr:hypothetical protein [Bacteriovoracaceae bacterium]